MKRAYHQMLMPDGTLIQGPLVVETDASGTFLRWHLLRGEEASTEWIGGLYDAAKAKRHHNQINKQR